MYGAMAFKLLESEFVFLAAFGSAKKKYTKRLSILHN